MKDLPFDPYDFFGYIASGVVVVATAQLIFGFPKVFAAELKPFDIAVTILAVYIAGQMIAGPARAVFEDVVIRRVLDTPTKNLRNTKRPNVYGWLFPAYYSPLPEAIRTKLTAKIKALNLASHEPEDIFLAIRFAPDVLANERLLARLDSFRDQYGFNRNVSFSLLLAGLCFLVAGHCRPAAQLTYYAITALVTSLLLFYRYLKFFRQYSYELLNTYACMNEKGTA